MNFTCTECNDTGSRDKLGTHLDCNACDTAATRRDLNDFVKSLGPTHPEDVALAIHQRALVMAPKQEAPWDSFDIERTGDEHIDASGFLLTAAMEWWYASRKAKVNGAVKWLEGEDGSLLIFTRGEYRDKLMANIDAYGCEPVKFFNDKQPPAAPAAANGAQYLTRVADFLADAVGGYSGGLADRIEEVIKQLRLDAGCGACGDACKGMTCRLQDESPSAVAAGSDAALVDAKHLVDITTAIMSQHGLIDHLSIGATQAFCDDLCAALSGAKGN